jgi:hypothetical protein
MRFSEGVQVLVSDAASDAATERVSRKMADWVRTVERPIHRSAWNRYSANFAKKVVINTAIE